VTTADAPRPDPTAPPPEVRIGTPERQAAEDALETHLHEHRLDATEFALRVEACQRARNRGELLRVFADLPVPHPELPPLTPTPPEPDGDPPPAALAGCLTLGLGLPVAAVLGFVHGTWWTLAVPVAVSMAMTYVEQFRRPAPTTDT
jgi:hypothetical protein